MNMKKIILSSLALTVSGLCLVACGSTTTQSQGVKSIVSTTQSQAGISGEEAQEIALKDAGLTSATYISNHQDFEDGQDVYDVTIRTEDTEYDYTISAKDGSILSKDQESLGQTTKIASESNTTQTTSLSNDQAKTKALEAAGLAESAASNLKIELDQENGRAVYEVSFDDLTKQLDYDYTIDANSGEILEQSQEPLND
ncbi:PepSY domain-containing protein [Streptococcus caprae]|uniref:PepSY domain-containing protein n=1 Tax=Streptococcus caprae TaxID=1640501 RepID=A0ABV8CWZ2_9STRE